jgi:hypothetical protein
LTACHRCGRSYERPGPIAITAASEQGEAHGRISHLETLKQRHRVSTRNLATWRGLELVVGFALVVTLLAVVLQVALGHPSSVAAYSAFAALFEGAALRWLTARRSDAAVHEENALRAVDKFKNFQQAGGIEPARPSGQRSLWHSFQALPAIIRLLCWIHFWPVLGIVYYLDRGQTVTDPRG